MTKKTIVKKLPTVDNLTPKKRGRKPKNAVEVIPAVETKTPEVKQPKAKKEKKITKRKITEIKQVAPENMAYVDFLKKENDDLKTVVDKHIKSLEKVKVAQTKFRTKYMQLEHERQTWNKTKYELFDIISKLRSLAMKYAPLDEVFNVASEITEISKKEKAGKKALIMPE